MFDLFSRHKIEHSQRRSTIISQWIFKIFTDLEFEDFLASGTPKEPQGWHFEFLRKWGSKTRACILLFGNFDFEDS